MSTKTPSSGRKTLWTVLRLAVAAALIVYLSRSGSLDWAALGGMLTSWWLSLAALGLILLATVGTSWRLCLLMAPRGLELTLWASIRLTLIGMFFNTVLPGAGGGDFVRLYYGARDVDGRKTEVVTVMLLDRICGMTALVLWPLLASPFFLSMWMGDPILKALLAAGMLGALAIVGSFLLAWSPLAKPDGPLSTLVQRLPLGGTIWTVLDTIASYRAHIRWVLAAVAVSLGVHTLGIGTALLIAFMTNPEGFDFAMSVLIPLGFMANTLPLTPGGLGVGEAAFDSLFGLAGLDGGAEVILGWRLLLLAVGLLGLGVYLQGRRTFVRTGPEE